MSTVDPVSIVENFTRPAPRPSTLFRFLLRLTLVSLALLWIANVYATGIVEFLLPAIRAEVEALDSNISIMSLDISQDGLSRVVRMRATLVMPIHTQQYVLYPMGWKPHTPGYQIMLNARGVILSSLLLLIVILSWPHRRFRDFVGRIALALPLCALLIAIDAPLELLGNFYYALFRDVDPNGFQALFAWDKFLEGGANFVLALALAALAILWTAPRQNRISGVGSHLGC